MINHTHHDGSKTDSDAEGKTDKNLHQFEHDMPAGICRATKEMQQFEQ
jgi:hypothetical protein